MEKTIGELAAPKSAGKKTGGKMRLKRLEVEEAMNGFVVRCNYEGSGKEMSYDTKVKVFESSDDMAKFVGSAFGSNGGGNPGKDEEEDDDY